LGGTKYRLGGLSGCMGFKMSFRGFMGLWWVMVMEKSSNRLRSGVGGRGLFRTMVNQKGIKVYRKLVQGVLRGFRMQTSSRWRSGGFLLWGMWRWVVDADC
jgi:hypothetical protein